MGKSEMKGQMTLDEYLKNISRPVIGGCRGCACRNCLYWWSARCPYGECWDDHRAKTDPYDRAHPGEPPRMEWSNWNKPGEQAHWCRGAACYPTHYCPYFEKYRGQQVRTCLMVNVSVFQDGYIQCSIVETVGCEECYRRFEERGEI